ncbi:MAG TPA: SDR family oxidoreductase [Candidatus Hydrogenedentes bacterium]|nr:SDR family oxidoreductase [Candidatus Hydrogenedentota bacterium]HPG65259.1 SDR family oxidoreductase [Candidatus Hydrogenedentota bacterium]
MDIDLRGKVAVVTGGTGELGRVMVRTLGRAGADVVVGYLQNRAKGDELVADLEGMGVRGMAIQVDVTDLDSVMALRDTARKQLGPANIIVNNAVIQYSWKHVLDQDAEDYESQFRSCVLHNVFMAKAFVPDMIKKKWGRVIGINTECAMQYWENQSAYGSAKRGMDGVLRVLAREIGPHNITVNQVAPGYTLSENRHPSLSLSERQYVKNVPLKRRGTDQEIANVVAFLASDLASFITGAYIPVSGGNVMPAI